MSNARALTENDRRFLFGKLTKRLELCKDFERPLPWKLRVCRGSIPYYDTAEIVSAYGGIVAQDIPIRFARFIMDAVDEYCEKRLTETTENDMKPVTNTIDLNAQPRFWTLAQIKEKLPNSNEWELRNDMIRSLRVGSCGHGFLDLCLEYASGAQPVGCGYRSEGNIGMMILWLGKLFGKYAMTTLDILAEFKNTPIRVLFRSRVGEPVAENTFIGHFMEDKFIRYSDIIMAGVVKETGGDE